MKISFGLTSEPTNTQFAPLALLLALYHDKKLFSPLENISTQSKAIDYSTSDKLQQILVSIMAGCETLSVVNHKLRVEPLLAQSGGWNRFSDQSNLSLCLDKLSLMNIEQLRQLNQAVLHQYGATATHDWRGFLWLDFDLSGLRCSARAEESEKGYFGGKKTLRDGN
jgi:hypothetical protein